MVEGGRIDHAGHANDIVRNVHETLEFNNAVEQAVDWMGSRTDTLILVTADHETGGLSVLPGSDFDPYPTVSWSTTSHTATPVPVYAIGAGAEQILGITDNTGLFAIAAVPEPSSLVMLAMAGAVFGLAWRRRVWRSLG